ncbi:MAG TPA: DUF222 domain-containing protein, partial [Tetrasphaera sp.]|nr:DUF222 domain-containing protein [Tetrasphaera sp.]
VVFMTGLSRASTRRELVRDRRRHPCVAALQAFRVSLPYIRVGELSDSARLDLIAELERLKGACSGLQARAAESVRAEREASAPHDAARSVGSEVALARRESPTLGDRFVGISRALVREMPATLAALESGAVSERHAVEMVRESATLSAEDRMALDQRLAPLLGRLAPRALGRAAHRVAAELDAGSIVRRMEAAVSTRRVTVRPAPAGKAYLTVLGPLREVVGAYAALTRQASCIASGQDPRELPAGRSARAIAADTALRILAGLEQGAVPPIEIHLVMTDRALLGLGDGARSVMEPARIPGHGSVPAPIARSWVRDNGHDDVWVRRLFTGPDGRDLVAMDSRKRVFTGLLRRMVVLRDDVCATPWCDAPIVQIDHTQPARRSGETAFANGSGLCARCNQVKESPGWRTSVVRASPRQARLQTPSGHVYESNAPPLLGWG